MQQTQLPENLIIFIEDSSKTIKEFYIPLLSPNNNKHVEISNGQWNQNGLKDVIKYIKEWKAPKITLVNNLCKTIIKEICSISFSCLLLLDIRLNDLQTVQPLIRVHMPNLRMLLIAENNISVLDELRKLSAEFLTCIAIENNKIGSFSNTLSEIYAPKLSTLTVEVRDISLYQCQDLNSFFKMSAKHLNWVIIRSEKRITQNAIIQQLEIKYSPSNIMIEHK